MRADSSTSKYKIAAQPRLLDQVRIVMRTGHYSNRTEKAYISWILRFIFFHHKRHPAEMGAEEIKAFINNLANNHHVSSDLTREI